MEGSKAFFEPPMTLILSVYPFDFLSNTLPLFSEISKRYVRFIIKRLFFRLSRVRHVVLNSVNVKCFNSYMYRNVSSFVRI